MRAIIRREFEVMFAKDTQPLWFRITKWTLYIVLIFILHGGPWFWIWVLGVPLAGLVMHLWGGWEYDGEATS
jgi:hypothetical protein